MAGSCTSPAHGAKKKSCPLRGQAALPPLFELDLTREVIPYRSRFCRSIRSMTPSLSNTCQGAVTVTRILEYVDPAASQHEGIRPLFSLQHMRLNHGERSGL